MTRAARIVAAVTALVAWSALALQLVLIVANLGPALGAWRFIGFFTVLTNIMVAVVASAMAWGCRNGVAGPRARLATATAIALVGIIYSVALRSLWSPQGWQKLADFALHDATPLLFVTVWALSPHGRLAWRDAGWALGWPALYAAYALARGAIDGWYAYWFLDPSTQSPGAMAASMAIMLAAFALAAISLVAIDRWLGRRA